MYYSDINELLGLNFKNGTSYMVFVPDGEFVHLNKIVELLQTKDVRFFGGVFPYILYLDKRYSTGIYIKEVELFEEYAILDMKSEGNENFFAHDLSMVRDKTAIVLVDGVSPHIKPFLQRLYNEAGSGIKFIGGGTGTLDFKRNSTIFSNDGVFVDSAVVAILDQNSILEAKHGWQVLVGPLVANKVEGNKIIELNWENAFEVYKEIIDNNSEFVLNQDDFYTVASRFPFGTESMGHEMIVRDPLRVTEKGEIVCVSDIPENSSLQILFGRKERILGAATELLVKYRKLL